MLKHTETSKNVKVLEKNGKIYLEKIAKPSSFRKKLQKSHSFV